MSLSIKKELTNVDVRKREILKKYPKIFAQKDLPMTQTCMCWGLDVGEGWLWLIDALCESIQEIVDSTTKYEQVEATQVKEKYGGLRFYYMGGNEKIDAIVTFAEKLSYLICENCGATKGVMQTDGWVVTLCPKCKKEYEDR